jgi:hypothetical protein
MELMTTELILAAAGGFLAWIFLRMILPFRISDRVMPLVMAGITFAVLGLPWRLQTALAAGTGIILLHRLTLGLETPGPWRLPPMAWPIRPHRDTSEPSGQGFRPGGGRGRRIPEL